MTLLDIRNQIISSLCAKATFTETDFAAIQVETELEERKTELIKAGLADLCEMGLLKSVGENLWILALPLNAAGQNVHLSMEVANGVAEVINVYLDANESDEYRVDSLNIQERDVVFLLQIIDELLAT